VSHKLHCADSADSQRNDEGADGQHEDLEAHDDTKERTDVEGCITIVE
jgi:hypothetical protein